MKLLLNYFIRINFIKKFLTSYENKILIDYINQFHNASLDIDSTFEDIIQYSLDVFKKIKDNMEYQLNLLENSIV